MGHPSCCLPEQLGLHWGAGNRLTGKVNTEVWTEQLSVVVPSVTAAHEVQEHNHSLLTQTLRKCYGVRADRAADSIDVHLTISHRHREQGRRRTAPFPEGLTKGLEGPQCRPQLQEPQRCPTRRRLGLGSGPGIFHLHWFLLCLSESHHSILQRYSDHLRYLL
ncbi:hypothetical protein WMY93_021498 [Mugilogobius chulae]|uniref:Uncharacterized protein n=1 Tax=Mugilogobius chulae TaxID=88201 RepID=A0AAW0NI18_9GOBI